jgi:predicted amidohydrolase YtcJ
MYLDGSLGARTAWLSRAYSDADSFGLSLVPGLSLMEQSSRALRLGFSLSFHALGDAAVDQALDLATSLAPDLQLHGRASSSLSWAPTRHRLEHTQVLREDQIFRIRDQGWCLVVQPHHRCSDEAFVQRRLGDRYPAQCYRAGSLMNAGIPLAWSTDAPVDSPSLAQILDALETHPESKERVFKLDAMWIATRGSRQSLGLKNDVVRRGSTVFLTEL